MVIEKTLPAPGQATAAENFEYHCNALLAELSPLGYDTCTFYSASGQYYCDITGPNMDESTDTIKLIRDEVLLLGVLFGAKNAPTTYSGFVNGYQPSLSTAWHLKIYTNGNNMICQIAKTFNGSTTSAYCFGRDTFTHLLTSAKTKMYLYGNNGIIRDSGGTKAVSFLNNQRSMSHYTATQGAGYTLVEPKLAMNNLWLHPYKSDSFINLVATQGTLAEHNKITVDGSTYVLLNANTGFKFD